MSVPKYRFRSDRRLPSPAWAVRAAVLCSLALLSWLTESAAAQPGVTAGRDVALAGILSEQQFLAGDRVRINAEVADDIFAAGRTVTVDGARAVMLVVGAGQLDLRNTTLRDLVAGGMGAEISATIEDDMVVGICPACPMGSGRLVIARSTRVGSDARLAAATIEMQGAIGGNLRAAARRIVISGDIAGNVDVRAGEIVIAPGARITGVLTARSPVPPDIHSGAQVGQAHHVPTDAPFPDSDSWGRGLVNVAAVAAIALMAGIFFFAALAQLIAPAIVAGGADRMRRQLWASVGIGLAILLLAPVLLMLLAMTLIGGLAAIVGGAALAVLLALALVTAAYGLGLWLRSKLTRSDALLPTSAGARIGWTLLGLLLLLLMQVVPIIGWIAGLIVFLAALGALAGGIRAQAATSPAA
jgi:hypothetical protein